MANKLCCEVNVIKKELRQLAQASSGRIHLEFSDWCPLYILLSDPQRPANVSNCDLNDARNGRLDRVVLHLQKRLNVLQWNQLNTLKNLRSTLREYSTDSVSELISMWQSSSETFVNMVCFIWELNRKGR